MAHNAPDKWARLGDQLTARRGELGYGGFRRRAAFARDRGPGRMSYRNFTRIETGERDYYPPETLDTIADIYQVTRASVRAVLDGTGNLIPATAGSAAIPKPGIAASGTAEPPDEVAVMLPRIVAENWENPLVRTLWGLDASEEGRLGLVRQLLGQPAEENGGRLRSSG